MFNPRARVETVALLPGHSCYVIDDALSQPERWVERAAEHIDAFEVMGHNAYPGPELRMPDEISARLDEFFAQHVRAAIGAHRFL